MFLKAFGPAAKQRIAARGGIAKVVKHGFLTEADSAPDNARVPHCESDPGLYASPFVR